MRGGAHRRLSAVPVTRVITVSSWCRLFLNMNGAVRTATSFCGGANGWREGGGGKEALWAGRLRVLLCFESVVLLTICVRAKLRTKICSPQLPVWNSEGGKGTAVQDFSKMIYSLTGTSFRCSTCRTTVASGGFLLPLSRALSFASGSTPPSISAVRLHPPIVACCTLLFSP